MSILFLFLISGIADRIVAKIGNNIILEHEVEEASTYLSLQLGLSREELKDKILTEAIERNLLLQEAEKESLTVSREEIEYQLEQTINEIIKRFPNREAFDAALKEEGLTVEELKNRSRKDAREKILVQKLIERKIAPTITISPTELKKFYDENRDSIALKPTTVRVKHIMLYIKPGEETVREAARRIQEVKRLLESGGDFPTLAREFSEDENSRRRGGMLGKIRKGEMFEEFEKVVWKLNPGEVSPPFQTRLGFHIVEVLTRDKESILLRQILIRVRPTSQDSNQTRDLGYRIYHQIQDESTFTFLAKKYSDESEIDLGEYIEDQIRPPFDQVVKKTPAGQASEPFLTPIGYHIIFVSERIPAQILSFDEIKDQLSAYLYQLKLKEKWDQMVARLKKEIFVQIWEKQ